MFTPSPHTAPPATENVDIDVAALRVGMFVHLDLGWMSHPFPLGSFRIASAEQIRTIQGLGVARVRWSPRDSDAAALADWGADGTVGAPAPAPAPAEPSPAAQAERDARKAALSAQRSAAALAERQYAEASRGWRQAQSLVLADPGSARLQTEALTRALLDKMLGSREVCIRLLTASAGDRASSHALNVSLIAMLMGKLLGLAEVDLMDLGLGAMLHDVGKIDLPDRLRFQSDQFSAAELRLYRDHVTHGVAHGRRMGLSPGALLVVAQHHEHADGSGFPQRLAVERMTAAARIVALVNRYDNLCNPAVPSRQLSPHEALSLLFAQGQRMFDLNMLNAFIRMMGVYPPGSVVQLTDDRYALVTTVNSSRPLRPRVLVHDPRVPQDEALLLDLEAEADVGIRRSMKAMQLPRAAFEYLAPRPRIAYALEAVAEPPG